MFRCCMAAWASGAPAWPRVQPQQVNPGSGRTSMPRPARRLPAASFQRGLAYSATQPANQHGLLPGPAPVVGLGEQPRPRGAVRSHGGQGPPGPGHGLDGDAFGQQAGERTGQGPQEPGLFRSTASTRNRRSPDGRPATRPRGRGRKAPAGRRFRTCRRTGTGWPGCRRPFGTDRPGLRPRPGPGRIWRAARVPRGRWR